ncbi:mannitol dehydrogenase family protein [Nocardioides sp. R1-1]|uniref:mannitol dehydrogenase family protein n=1 Tax=Nocardioides sp. R1-1 TaxID=3383502 RepID=UPI0038D0FB77
MINLCQSTLPQLACSRLVDVPTYDRSALRPSVVHIGVGGFHRAHQAVYLDDLARAGSTEWGEVGVSLRSRGLCSELAEQDDLFSVVELGTEGERPRVVAAMTDYLFGPDDPRAVVARLALPDTRLVTLTVTGDGYDDAGEVGATAPEDDATWSAYLVAALAQRRGAGLGGFTVLSCDNRDQSGAAARNAVLRRAARRDETLARWIRRNVTFPEAMVDRITPGSGDQLRALMARRYGLTDRSPVATEPFRQWVIEDSFCQGRPPLEDVGAQLVSDVAPYKVVKSRLLNGTHTAVAYLGWLAGHRTTAELTSDPTMLDFLTELMRSEVAPQLVSVPGMGIDDYVDTVLQRLANPRIADPLDRLCRRGSTKVPAYLLPALSAAVRAGRRAPLLTLALAGWFRYLRGVDLHGRVIEIDDARLAELQPLARRGGHDPAPLLGVRDVLGGLGEERSVRTELRRALGDLDHGVAPAVRRALARADHGWRHPLAVTDGSLGPSPDLIS